MFIIGKMIYLTSRILGYPNNNSYLKEEILAVIIRKCLGRLNNLMQISVHEFVNEINILKIIPMIRHHDVFQSNNILMVKMSKKFQFTQSSKRINAIFKRILYLLYCNFLICFPIDRRTNNPISSSTNRLNRHIFGVNFKQGLPHGKIMLSFNSYPVRRLNRSRHSLQIKFNNNPAQQFLKF